MGSKLFLIGNGFDLHHGIASRFSDFGRSVAASDPNIVRLIDEYLFVDKDFWNCLEARLATFDADAFLTVRFGTLHRQLLAGTDVRGS